LTLIYFLFILSLPMDAIPIYNFQHDLALSKESVNKVIDYLTSIGAIDILQNDDSRYDISFTLDSKTFTMEVKEDFMYHRTGNVAIEYSSREKDSGVATSVADLWCYVLNRGIGYDGTYFVNLSTLRKHLETHTYPQSEGGDNLTSKLYLMPISSFISVFQRKSK
jgi:hypothetical protein